METPNLSVLKEIAGDDLDFLNNLIEIIKKEFLGEVEEFNENISSKDLQKAANSVHKIKHKLSLLGLEEGLKIASDFEKQLKNNETQLHHKFLEILNKIHVYLYN